jgi:transposase
MKTDTTKPAGDVADQTLFDDWFDPVETGLRSKLRGFIETMIEEELDTALSRARYGRRRKLTAADNAAAIGLLYKHSSDRIWLVMLHRTRDLLIRQRSSLISAIRAHFAEFGIVVGQGIRNVERLLALLETARDQRLPALAAEMLGILAAQLRYVAEQVKEVEVKLLARHRADETSRRLQSVPGLGPITASAIVATVGDPKRFKSGRQFAAWLGLVPQQRSSGGKERLGGISKRGDGYIRRLLVHGARAIVGWRKRSATHKTSWIERLLARRPTNVAT